MLAVAILDDKTGTGRKGIGRYTYMPSDFENLQIYRCKDKAGGI